ncbi:MAG TPA: sugar phosphate isomerase/epimerase [Fimbriiglobus sp.]|jgi:sugar phosphate isomerase/epimerase
MQLGFVSAVLHDMRLEEVLAFAADEGFACVELMCWPPGKADRRYAGVTHLDVSDFTPDKAAHVQNLARMHGVGLAGLGYYPNPLDPDPEHARTAIEHLKKLIRAAPMVGVNVVNTFIGRDPVKSVDANFAMVAEVWPSIVKVAKSAGVTIGIEHCPMLYTADEWPGGKNLPINPETWRRLFGLFPGTVGLNFDPSHLVWQFIDCGRAVREFGKHIVHVHAKDERVDREQLHQVGVTGLGWHVPKLPGLGDVKWGEFFAALTDVGYAGPVCIEVEDRAYEASLADRKRAVRQSKKFLEQFFG